jgi:ATP-dependent Lon protease
VGIDTVILPERNEPDLEDIPQEIRDKMSFVLIERVDQVFDAALRDGSPQADEKEPGEPDPGD